MRDAPVTGIACVIDRPGYNARYEDKYRENRWMLCKTAFSVVVERSAKFAIANCQRLRVLPEKCNKAEDGLLRSYYNELKTDGLPSMTRVPASMPHSAKNSLATRSTTFGSKPSLLRWLSWPTSISGRFAWVATIAGTALTNVCLQTGSSLNVT